MNQIEAIEQIETTDTHGKTIFNRDAVGDNTGIVEDYLLQRGA